MLWFQVLFYMCSFFLLWTVTNLPPLSQVPLKLEPSCQYSLSHKINIPVFLLFFNNRCRTSQVSQAQWKYYIFHESSFAIPYVLLPLFHLQQYIVILYQALILFFRYCFSSNTCIFQNSKELVSWHCKLGFISLSTLNSSNEM